MTLLARSFPALSMVPHVPLAQTTPVERLDALCEESGAEVWVKRDDRTATLYGGNKVRKLEFLLGDARQRGAKTLVTAGAWGSHHVLATTLFGTKWGFDVHAVMVPQPLTPHAENNLRCVAGAGATLHPVRNWVATTPTVAALVASLNRAEGSAYRVAYGGSSVVGALGFVEAGLELAAQIARGECPEPDAIYVPLGSGGTAAGLAVGLAAAGLTTEVIAVRVTPLIVCNRATVTALVVGILRHLRALEISFPSVRRAALGQLRIDGSFFGAGYGERDPAAERASEWAAKVGLSVDPTYTSKSLAALMRDASGARRGQRLLFWLTLSSADLSDRVKSAPPLPDFARR